MSTNGFPCPSSLKQKEQKWSVGRIDYDWGSLIVRYNETAKEWFAHPDLPIKLSFAIPLNSPVEGGLPSPDENSELDLVEDVIRDEVNANILGVHVLALSTGTVKEFVFYVASDSAISQKISKIHEAVKSMVLTHQVQCIAKYEPEWDSYKEFLPSN